MPNGKGQDRCGAGGRGVRSKEFLRFLVVAGFVVMLTAAALGGLYVLRQQEVQDCKTYLADHGYTYLFDDAHGECWGERNGTEWRAY